MISAPRSARSCVAQGPARILVRSRPRTPASGEPGWLHIEGILGVRLFDRSTRSVRITTAGKEFVAVAERILNDLRITLRSMRELSDQQRGQVIVSSIMSVANGQLPRLVAEYRKAFPGIEIHVRDGVHGGVLEDVRSGAADFGITYLGEL